MHFLFFMRNSIGQKRCRLSIFIRKKSRRFIFLRNCTFAYICKFHAIHNAGCLIWTFLNRNRLPTFMLFWRNHDICWAGRYFATRWFQKHWNINLKSFNPYFVLFIFFCFGIVNYIETGYIDFFVDIGFTIHQFINFVMIVLIGWLFIYAVAI